MNNEPGNGYVKVFEMLQKVFEGDMEAGVFEERARYIFPTKAYILFTLDKVIGSLLKNVSIVPLRPSYGLRAPQVCKVNFSLTLSKHRCTLLSRISGATSSLPCLSRIACMRRTAGDNRSSTVCRRMLSLAMKTSTRSNMYASPCIHFTCNFTT